MYKAVFKVDNSDSEVKYLKYKMVDPKLNYKISSDFRG